ncbi:nucleotidyltransferase family protein [Lederbergia galactosidilytica]|uniref:Nucleotidyltransferase family protein n=1 Tax=Lederbergia galactosidilytica TaxID=217031 RepID=A0A0Q9Y073_9BACI|nr:nucleotidyltransferase family protein [Lederbergia galactosidilytica]KRG14416.1 hypothetical protein ACA29_06030 [Lederbergia galactosidilytica]KRG14826.1 hypothetical protein ACA30_09090 [Virgibacillus soli]MBP1914496.1 hypothetical protein [Lederbergia galactosidilytica]OAK69073.1 hypothetical protein ABB05_13945 [Lederbergia galactosidilytica]
MLVTKEDVINCIQQDEWMMGILKDVQTLNLPDWWICAGFVRSKIWDQLHNYPVRTPLADIDVVYFDPSEVDKQTEKEFEKRLAILSPHLPWSVKNQARMHEVSGMTPYISSVDGIKRFPETVTALGVKLDEKEKVVLTAPWGVRDVLKMEIRPTKYYIKDSGREVIYAQRIASKNWLKTWPLVKIYGVNGKLVGE